MKEALTFERAFGVVMERELGCTIERSKAILDLVNKEMVEFNKMESRLMRSIKAALEKGIVFNEHGGIISGAGEENFFVYFLNPSGVKGIVPSRFFKETTVSEDKMRRMLVNCEDVKFELCSKCQKKAPVIEAHYYYDNTKEIYTLIYCERCNRIFVDSLKKEC